MVEKLTPRQRAVLPVVFFDYFSFPLSKEEWSRYVVREALPVEQLADELPCIRGYFVMPGREELVIRRRLRADVARYFWSRVKKWWWLFRLVPFFRGVALSNTLSYGNVDKNSDIDLVVITSEKRLWLARAFYSFLFSAFGQKVVNSRKYGKFSAEVWLEEDDLAIESWQDGRDFYLAFWSVDLLPVAGDEYFQKFRSANRWAAQILPRAYAEPRKSWNLSLGSGFSRFLEFILRGRLGDILNDWAFRYQSRLIRQAAGRIGVNPSLVVASKMAKLHFNDARMKINNTVLSVLEKYS